MLEVCLYLSQQVQEAWAGQETSRGMVVLPLPETDLGSD